MTVKCQPPSMTASLDRPLHAVGFQYDLLSSERLTGHLTITESCCQPFKVLHGGVTAMIAEGMASMGAYINSGFQRVAGVQLSTNHIRAAQLGEFVHVEAIPIQKGRTIQAVYQRRGGRGILCEHIYSNIVENEIRYLSMIYEMRTFYIALEVWEVQLLKIDPSISGDKKGTLLSTSRVTLLSNLPSSNEMKGFEDTVKKYAKL